MAKKKRVSVNAFEKNVVIDYEYKPYKWGEIEIMVKPRLDFLEMMTFVDGVVQGCFRSDDNSFLPEVKDFIIKSYIVEMYSNIALPQNVNKKYDLLYACDIVDYILEIIDKSQFEEIMKGIDQKIKYMVAMDVNTITTQMNQLLSSLSGVESKASQLFDGISKENIDTILKAISNGRIDESKIMEAYLEHKNRGET